MAIEKRRRSRELAMQALFYMDMRQKKPEEMISFFEKYFLSSKKVPFFFMNIVKGVDLHKEEIDSIIEQFSSNWKISRMSCVDRNIIRIAVYELLFCDDIPAKVSINEAIDIGKKFGDKDSGSFINAVLDSIRIKFEKKEA